MMPVTRAKRVLEITRVLAPHFAGSDTQLENAKKLIMESTGFRQGSNPAIMHMQEGEHHLRKFLERKGYDTHHAEFVAGQVSVRMRVLGAKFDAALKDTLKAERSSNKKS